MSINVCIYFAAPRATVVVTTRTIKVKLNENFDSFCIFEVQKNLLKSYASSSPLPVAAAVFRFLAVGGGAFATDFWARSGSGCFALAGTFASDLLDGGADR